MQHIDFIVWMIAFPLSQAIGEAIRWQYCERREYSASTRGQAALITVTIWFVVGGMLW